MNGVLSKRYGTESYEYFKCIDLKGESYVIIFFHQSFANSERILLDPDMHFYVAKHISNYYSH